MENKLIEQALDNNGHDLELVIKSLCDLRLGCYENLVDDAEASLNAHPQPITLPRGGSVQGDEDNETVKDSVLSRNGAEWADVFVKEMFAACDVDDAKIRALRAYEALEKSIYACAKVETSQYFQQDNSILKKQVQELLRENGILKRAVAILHKRQKEFQAKSEEVQHLKQLLSQYNEHIKTLEVNNYALAMHLKQAQQNKSISGRSNLDIL